MTLMGEEEEELKKPQQPKNQKQKPKPSSLSLSLEIKQSATAMAIAVPIPSSSSSSLTPAPSWFTPKRLLAIFCVINLLNYVDRGAIASNGVNGSPRICTESDSPMPCSPGPTMITELQVSREKGLELGLWSLSVWLDYMLVLTKAQGGDFNLNNFEDGVISSAFMVGLLVASPIFASLAKSVNPFRLIGVGLSVWTFATFGCGFSFDFWSITICRMLVGVGEASFISLAAPFIDDNAPPAQKTAWLGIFYMCIPSGTALGYVYGGLVGGYFNWRLAFWVEAFLMLPFAILGFAMKPLQMKGFSSAGSKKEVIAVETLDSEEQVVLTAKGGELPKRSNDILNQLTMFWRDMKVLLLEKVYVVNVLGYIAYNFVIGAYSYWGPKAGNSIYHMNNADIIFGGVTILCGVLGSLGGGYVLDSMTSTLPNAFKLLSAATFFGAIFCFVAFCFKSLYAFIALFSIGELLVFATQAPVNYVSLHSVKPGLRPLSMAISTVSIHIFGDVPSSPLVGVLQDHIHNWRASALSLTSILFLAAAIWFIGIFLHAVDKFNEDSEHPAIADRSSTTPLLQEKTAESGESSGRTITA